MSDKIHLWPEPYQRTGGELTVAAQVEANGERSRLWYRVPESIEPALTPNADPFAIALVFAAMRAGKALVVHGRVSPSLLANLEEFQSVWHAWRPERYQCVEIQADQEADSPAAPNSFAIVGFSGGVDSCFTVFRHTRTDFRRKRDIRAGLLVQGFDVAVRAHDVFRRVASRASEVLGSVAVQPICLATNWRELGMDWVEGHGAALASCLTLFAGRFRYGLVASTEPYAAFVPWGSNPLTDPFLSSESFSLIHDGAAWNRIEKVSLIAGWPEAVRSLRVCPEAKEQDRNCGECEKCIRTILNFRVLGYGVPPCFGRDVDSRQIRTVRIRTSTQLNELRAIVEWAERHGSADEDWVRQLRRRLLLWRLGSRLAPRTRLRNWLRHVKRPGSRGGC